MPTPSLPNVGERLLSELDHVRLSRLLNAHTPQQGPLQALLDAADLLPPQQLPADVVTMNSEVEVLGPQPGLRQRLTLCYPAEASPEQGRISVLSPVGLSLLGRAVGDEISWHAGHGSAGRMLIQALPYQPEASGDYSR
jgi:regulator of nucleoside diphosphate kinase